MRIVHGTVNHMENPLGFQMGEKDREGKTGLVFQYRVIEATGKREEASRLVVSSSADMETVLLDTGWESHPVTGIPVSLSLSPRTRYYWTVSVRTDAGEEEASDCYWFETGKDEEPFAGKWITCGRGDRSPVFWKTFSVSSKVPVVSARLYITGLGVYEASLNGERVSDEYLTPYCNNYNEWIQVQAFDVTSELVPGENTLSAEIGDGWFAGRFTYDSKPGGPPDDMVRVPSS